MNKKKSNQIQQVHPPRIDETIQNRKKPWKRSKKKKKKRKKAQDHFSLAPSTDCYNCAKWESLHTCLHSIDGYAKSAVYCLKLFLFWIHNYDPSLSRKQTVLLHPRRPGISRAMVLFSSLLLQRGWGESRSRDAPLGLHLMLRKKGGRGEKKNLKRLFSTCDKSCSHMGGTRASDLTKGCIGWSQWAIQRQPSREVSRWHPGAGCSTGGKKTRTQVNGTFSGLWRN